MDIQIQIKQNVKVSDLKYGELFMHDNKVFMKTSRFDITEPSIECVRMSDGCVCNFMSDTKVTPVIGELHIADYKYIEES